MSKVRQDIIEQVAERILNTDLNPDEARILNIDKGWYFGGQAYHLTDQEISQAIRLAQKLGS